MLHGAYVGSWLRGLNDEEELDKGLFEQGAEKSSKKSC